MAESVFAGGYDDHDEHQKAILDNLKGAGDSMIVHCQKSKESPDEVQQRKNRYFVMAVISQFLSHAPLQPVLIQQDTIFLTPTPSSARYNYFYTHTHSKYRWSLN